MVIGINCGHTVSGSVGSGAVGILNESDETRRVGYALEELFRKAGDTVVDCTNDRAATVTENLRKICSMANAQKLDLFVSIHLNSGGGKGCEVYTYGGKKLPQAEGVLDEMKKLGFTDRGVKDGANLYVIRHTDAPAMLVEVCFVDTPSDARLYTETGAEKIAEAIYAGITGKAPDEKEENGENGGELTLEQYKELSARIEKLEKAEKIEKPMIYNYIDGNMPEWAREAVRWCADNGIILGTGGGLGLNDEKLWTCVVIYRLAAKLK